MAADEQLVSATFDDIILGSEPRVRKSILSLGKFRECLKLVMCSNRVTDGDGFIGSYGQLLLLQRLFDEILKLEAEIPATKLLEARGNKGINLSEYFDDVMGIGTGG